MKSGDSLRSVGSLEWLHDHGLDSTSIHTLTEQCPTWTDWTALPLPQRINLLGQQSAGWTIPTTIPEPAGLPADTTCHTRYQLTYPTTLARLRTPPTLLYQRGPDHDRPTVAIISGRFVNPHGIEIARDVVRTASLLNLQILLRHHQHITTTAARHALELGVPITLVADDGVDTFDMDTGLVRDILESGGQWITTQTPRNRQTAASDNDATLTLIGLADLVVLAHNGLSADAGLHYAQEAVRYDKPIVVSAPMHSGEPGEQLPASNALTPLFATPGSFDPQHVGTNSRIERRIRSGKPAADAVIDNPSEFVTVFTELLALNNK